MDNKVIRYVQIKANKVQKKEEKALCENWIQIFKEKPWSQFKNKTMLEQEGCQAEED